jgi:hypothetical protein
MEEIENPIEDYASYFKELHARNVSAYFEDLVKRSQIDEQLNIQTISELRELEKDHSQGSSSRKKWRIIKFLLIGGGLALVALAILQQGVYLVGIVPVLAGVWFLINRVNPQIKSLNNKIAELVGVVKLKSDEAWLQMAPLNQLHSWDVAQKLFQETIPDIEFDRYLTGERLNDLQNNFGLSPNFTDGRSMLLAHSGAFKQNPFAVARYKHHWIGSCAYSGFIVIYWTESERDADGDWIEVQKSQTLTATIHKPFPEYVDRTTLLYGHEAAPNLSFSRGPSKLSGLDDKMMTTWRKGHAIKQVERKARKDVRTGDGQLTMMSNREFEALFKAIDRDHEIEFRLMFSPLAQQEMVKLLNDRDVGYGDNFAFHKEGMVNFIETQHLAHVRLDGDPKMYATLECAQARKFFNEFHAELFKSLYFAFAPLWTVPLYRDKRSNPRAGNQSVAQSSSHWEHEAMCNSIGENTFKHPESITQNILKTNATLNADGTSSVDIMAYGYKGIPQVEIVTMLGGDGNYHAVPVPWTEYVPVSRQSEMLVAEIKNPSVASLEETDFEREKISAASFQSRGIDLKNVYSRNGLIAVLVQ